MSPTKPSPTKPVRPDATPARFSGWPKTMYAFFDGLEEDNSRDYFLAQKDTYSADVRGPMEALIAHCTTEFGEAHLFRPQRDTRFAKDKRPYKDNIACVFRRSGAIAYVSVDGSGLFVGSGYYMMSPEQLLRFRTATGDEATGPALAAILDRAHQAGLSSGEPALQRVPKPFVKDHPRETLLRHKSMVVARKWDQPAWLHQRRALTEITKVWRAAAELNQWLAAHVGPA